MKECPKCKKIYESDLFYCLDDGTPLVDQRIDVVDPTARTEAAYNLGYAAPTELLPNAGRAVPTEVLPGTDQSIATQAAAYTAPPSSSSSSGFAYVAIGALVLLCLVLGAALLILNRDQLFSSQVVANQAANDAKSIPSPSPALAKTPQSGNTNASPTPTVKPPSADLTPAGKWKGKWSTDSGTLFDFDLTLNETSNKTIEGQIKWTMRKTARPDKADKIGLSATEFVQGTFDTTTGDVKMHGFNKDDPNGVLVMLDDYKLTVSPDGKSLTGSARNGGKWNGHIKLSR